MKAKLVVFSCALFVCVIAGTALADVQPWPGTKWFQPPEMEEEWGQDWCSQLDSTGAAPTQVVMDDWLCTDNTSPVKGFRWWGSYFNDHSIDDISGFHLSIHADIPAGAAASHPAPGFLHQQYFTLEELGYEEGGYQKYIGDDSYGSPVYEYFALFDECFWQTGTAADPVVYWVDIFAVIDNADQDITNCVWGWHTSSTQNIDDAVKLIGYIPDTGEYTDFTVIEYAGHGSVDMAFEVIPEPSTLLLAVPAIFGLATVIRRRK